MRLQSWVRGFNPYKGNSSLAQVWVRFYEIPMEYFHPTIIHAMASALGTVLKLDERTKNRSMCHYAQVLIEMDMKKGCEECIMFESEGQVLFSSLKYEQLPLFCHNCGIVGHALDTCRVIAGQRTRDDKEAGKVPVALAKPKPRVDGGTWIPKDTIPNTKKVASHMKAFENHNAFVALVGLEEGEVSKEKQLEDSMDSSANDEQIEVIPATTNGIEGAFIQNAESSKVVASSKKGKARGRVTKEYNLRNKAGVSQFGGPSPPFD